MSISGLMGLLIAFTAGAVSVVCFFIAHIFHRSGKRDRSDGFAWAGRFATVIVCIALTFCCGILVFCFVSGDVTLDYVVRNRSDSTDSLALLYKISGLWAGRAGSLLLWAWLISVFNASLVFAKRKSSRPLDNGAIAISQLVLMGFLGVLLFSESNMPFALLDSQYLNADGTLISSAEAYFGMNTLLEHWAMAIHPPTLFCGYAGLTIPFAYAISALIINDDSDAWVCASTPYLMFSWLLLTIGIGLGSVWAYVVLGWGGYWGWDPVENASLLPWLVGVALIHSFTVYRQRGQFKRWSIMCAALAFSFVILGTFITRSGLVDSVHAFSADQVSLVLFLVLIVVSLLAAAAGLIIRRCSFGDEGENTDLDSFFSRDAAYYINNLILVVFAVLLAYMTISSALPTFLPLGGQSVSSGTYNAIARPLGIIYCAIIAICPLLGWRRTNGRAFWRAARIPGICAAVCFCLLAFYFATALLPSYQAIISTGGTAADELLEMGHPVYYNALALVGFAVASLLIFNAAFMVCRALGVGRKRLTKDSKDSKDSEGSEAGSEPKVASPVPVRRRLSRIAGGICHAGMGVVLVGLIGSSMYVTEISGYVEYDPDTDTASEDFAIDDYVLSYASNSVTPSENNDDILYTVVFDVSRDGQDIGQVSPTIDFVQSTQQSKLMASVISSPLEDLFVVYRGVNDEEDFALDVRVNPLISFVWAGFGIIVAGSVLTLFANRKPNPQNPSKTREKQDSPNA